MLKYDKLEVDDIMLVGGTTRKVKIRTLLREFFNTKRTVQRDRPDEAVTCDAPVQFVIPAYYASRQMGDMLMLEAALFVVTGVVWWCDRDVNQTEHCK